MSNIEGIEVEGTDGFEGIGERLGRWVNEL